MQLEGGDGERTPNENQEVLTNRSGKPLMKDEGLVSPMSKKSNAKSASKLQIEMNNLRSNNENFHELVSEKPSQKSKNSKTSRKSQKSRKSGDPTLKPPRGSTELPPDPPEDIPRGSG